MVLKLIKKEEAEGLINVHSTLSERIIEASRGTTQEPAILQTLQNTNIPAAEIVRDINEIRKPLGSWGDMTINELINYISSFNYPVELTNEIILYPVALVPFSITYRILYKQFMKSHVDNLNDIKALEDNLLKIRLLNSRRVSMGIIVGIMLPIMAWQITALGGTSLKKAISLKTKMAINTPVPDDKLLPLITLIKPNNLYSNNAPHKKV